MSNLELIKELNEESQALCEDLRLTRLESADTLDEIESEFFNILGRIKLLLANNKINEAKQYVNEEYQILKKDLIPEYQSEE